LTVAKQLKPLTMNGSLLPVSAGLIGRLPLSMMSLVQVFLLRHSGFDYLAVGAVVAVNSAGSATFGPLLGRVIDRFGQTRVLVPLALCWPLSVVAMVHFALQHQLVGTLICAGLAGMLLPPMPACVRTAWPALLPAGELRERALTLDAVLQEIVFFSGPILVVYANSFGSPAVSAYVAAAAGGLGTAVFACSRAARGQRGSRADEARSVGKKRPLAVAGVRTLAATFVCIGAGWAGLTLVLTAITTRFGYASAFSGWALALLSVGSVIGGVWASSVPTRGRTRRRLGGALILHTALLALLMVIHGEVPLAILMLIAGIPVAPALGSAYTLIGELSPKQAVTEAFTWLSSALLIGGAIGAATVGFVIDRSGVVAGTAVTVVLTGLSAAAVFGGWRGLATEAAPADSQPVFIEPM
jgi:predicted MFS family arabinose efflux permease